LGIPQDASGLSSKEGPRSELKNLEIYPRQALGEDNQ